MEKGVKVYSAVQSGLVSYDPLIVRTWSYNNISQVVKITSVVTIINQSVVAYLNTENKKIT